MRLTEEMTKKVNKSLYPKVGDPIYVHGSSYVYRGRDDFRGGLASISEVRLSNHLPEDHVNYIMVSIK